jgi:hypothetical protein
MLNAAENFIFQNFGVRFLHHNSTKPANWFMSHTESSFNIMSGEYRMGQMEYAYTIMGVTN